jgi:probable rRNA maturation factor
VTVQVRVEHGAVGPGFDQIIRASAEATLQEQGIAEGGLTVVLVDEERMTAIHEQFAGVAEVTDVLSFPDGTMDPDSGSTYFGDVFICPPVAMISAGRGGHSLQDEVSLLTVHGVLHLLGHDHASPEARAAMWPAQARVLRRLGSAVQPPEPG